MSGNTTPILALPPAPKSAEAGTSMDPGVRLPAGTVWVTSRSMVSAPAASMSTR